MPNPSPQISLLLEERPLPEPEATIWSILSEQHRGRAAAIPMPELAYYLNLSTRALQNCIEWLIKEHGKPIGSSCGKPSGYYVIADAKDLELTFRNRVNRGIANLAAAYRLKKTPEVLQALGQLGVLDKAESETGRTGEPETQPPFPVSPFPRFPGSGRGGEEMP